MGLGAASTEQTIRGRLGDIDAAQKTVRVNAVQTEPVALSVGPQTVLELNGRPVTLDQFREGQHVRATIEKTGDQTKLIRLSGSTATDDDIAREASQTLQAIKQYSFEQRHEYERKLRGVLDNLDDRIDDLRARAYRAKGEARARYAEEIDRLQARRGELNNRLSRVRSSTAAAWDEVRGGVSAAADELRDAWNRAREQFRD